MRVRVGELGVLRDPVPALCCSTVIPAGERVWIYKQWSPKRVMVQLVDRPDALLAQIVGGSYAPAHKVKASKIWWQGETQVVEP